MGSKKSFRKIIDTTYSGVHHMKKIYCGKNLDFDFSRNHLEVGILCDISQYIKRKYGDEGRLNPIAKILLNSCRY